MKMQYVLREIPEKFSAKGGYTVHFVNQLPTINYRLMV